MVLPAQGGDPGSAPVIAHAQGRCPSFLSAGFRVLPWADTWVCRPSSLGRGSWILPSFSLWLMFPPSVSGFWAHGTERGAPTKEWHGGSAGAGPSSGWVAPCRPSAGQTHGALTPGGPRDAGAHGPAQGCHHWLQSATCHSSYDAACDLECMLSLPPLGF